VIHDRVPETKSKAFDSMKRRDAIVERLWRGKCPFKEFTNAQKTGIIPSPSLDPQGWRSEHEYLTEAVERIKPELVVEIGVWKGGSCCTMAKAMKTSRPDSALIAVDTWRGSSEHWINNSWFPSLIPSMGSTYIQNTFLANVIHESLDDIVVPLPLDSINAYNVCSRLRLHPSLIHIDGAHDYRSVALDLELWSSVLSPGGTILLDDYLVDDKGIVKGWPGVARAVNEFVASRKEGISSFRSQRGKCEIILANVG
jgi:hypothetical protein